MTSKLLVRLVIERNIVNIGFGLVQMIDYTSESFTNFDIHCDGTKTKRGRTKSFSKIPEKILYYDSVTRAMQTKKESKRNRLEKNFDSQHPTFLRMCSRTNIDLV